MSERKNLRRALCLHHSRTAALLLALLALACIECIQAASHMRLQGATAAAAAAEGLAQQHGERGPRLARAVVLFTQFGSIRIRLLEKAAPRITALVWNAAKSRNCSKASACAFYR